MMNISLQIQFVRRGVVGARLVLSFHASYKTTPQLVAFYLTDDVLYIGTPGPNDRIIPDIVSEDGQPDDSSLHPPSSRNLPPHSPSPTPLGDKSRKPSALRKASNKRPVPHRGQGFSVDDDVKEVEQDSAMQQVVSSNPLRRQSSTLRRRTAAQIAIAPRITLEDNNEEDNLLPEPSLEDSGEGSSRDLGGEQNEDNVSDAESFTLKDRQEAINETHPFGIRIWKPALYKKNRSVEKSVEGDIHSSPGGRVSTVLFMANLLWTLFFGWWLALVALAGAIVCFLLFFSPSAMAYGKVFSGLSRYVLYPFGSFVRLEGDENYAEEDEGEGRSISEYEQWQSGDLEHGRLFFGPHTNRSLIGRRRSSLDSASEHDSLLGRTGRGQSEENPFARSKRRLFGRGEWNLSRVVFFLFFYLVMGPAMLLVSLLCWLLVFWIPMARVMNILFDHLRRHPLALSFHSDSSYSRLPSGPSSSILLCTYRAAGLRYWKYTIDGTNIFLINLLSVVLFVIFDYFILDRTLGVQSWLSHPGLIFTLALFSVIPLAYFIGQAVASISAQSSMGLGAAINAFFSTIVEVYLYCVALGEGKAHLVEGSVIGSLLAGILFLPGLSMCFGAIKRKTQRFNVKSAGVTSTMLLFAVIAAFGPTLFYQIYGSHELNCRPCSHLVNPSDRNCRRCYFSQVPAVDDQFFIKAVQPYSWFAAVFLFLSYVIGLWFTLRTHAAVIWATDADEKKPTQITLESSTTSNEIRQLRQTNPSLVPGGDLNGHRHSIRDSALYKRILGQSLRQVGLSDNLDSGWEQIDSGNLPSGATPHVVPPRQNGSKGPSGLTLSGLSEEENEYLARQVAEVAATAATIAARDAARSQRKPVPTLSTTRSDRRPSSARKGTAVDDHDDSVPPFEPSHSSGGHDAPNWSKIKSSIILLGATFLYAVIAEILVNTVDIVLESVNIDEKFLGITLFALVPNTTEFLNAISFAMNGNIALSMEIGSAYALQVCLLQIPALVLFSAYHTRSMEPAQLLEHSFNLIFPQWDMVVVILCVFLLSYVYGEGKSNYFKGSILVLTYLVVVIGFYLSGYNNLDLMGVDPYDTLALGFNGPEKFRVSGGGSGQIVL
ncbi:hypothetical protein Egran_05448 [Elaphomyces granulatus]|uniref:Sodium/calcium exchanger membrane region domain-containing protein n=1 Tax=Elaphomyces granulatus TaxID=519963 RepID=A0A232LRM1_9EURO|nr:hypothetical protein Egran_05448 [Elaphomyces granulatus]